MKRMTMVAAFVGMLSLSPGRALELNFGGEYTKIPTHGPAAGPAQRVGRPLRFQLRSQLYGTRLSGDQARSYKDEKSRYMNLLSARYEHPFASSGQSLRVTADLKNSNDRRLQEDQVELVGFLLDYSRGDDHRFRAGDISMYGGRYTFQRSILGAKYEYAASLGKGTVDARAGYGRVDEAVEGFRYRRMLFAGGVRWEGQAGPRAIERISCGLEYASTRDAEDSIDEDAGLVPFGDHVVGLEVDAQLALDARVRGEAAFSSLKNERTDRSSSDHALALELEKGLAAGSLRCGWEEVQPEFRSLSGSGLPDSRRLYGYFRGRAGRRVDLTAGISRQQNGMSGPRQFTSTVPSLSIGVRPFAEDSGTPALQQLRVSLRLTRPTYETDDGSMERSNLSHYWRATTAVRDWRVGLTYTGQNTEDEVVPASDRERDGWGAFIFHPAPVKREWFSGNLSFSFNRDADGLAAAADRNERSGLRLRSSGQIFQTLYGCGLDIQDVSLATGGGDYTRTSWDVSLSRRLPWLQDLSLGVVVQGADRDADGEAGDLTELTGRVQVQASF